MLVLIINPPSKDHTVANREGAGGLGTVTTREHGFFYPTQTIAYIAAVLKQHSYDVKIIDAVLLQYNVHRTLKAIKRVQFDVIGVYISYKTIYEDIAFCKLLKENYPHTPIIVFGVSTKYCLQEILKEAAPHMVIVGEPEFKFLAACNAIKMGKTQTIFTDDTFYIENLDVLPFPAWDMMGGKLPFYTVMSSRGCEHSCTYCPYVMAQGKKLRKRSIMNVLEEIKWLKRNFHLRKLVFRDPVFAYDRERTYELCNQLIKEKIKIHWECESRPDHFDKELIEIMEKAGCIEFKIGFETVNENTLIRLKRIRNSKEYREYLHSFETLVKYVKRAKLRVFVMQNLPGEKEEDFIDTLKYLRQFKIDYLHIKQFEIYPEFK